jgi:two-component system sensor histidine kinase PilS (NtrC family)
MDALHGDPWKTLWLYSIYRLILAAVLIFVGFSQYSPLNINYLDEVLFILTIGLYLFLAIAGNITAYIQWPNHLVQISFNTITDVIIMLKVIYSTGGVSAELGLLIAIPLFTLNFLRPGQVSLFITALGIIALLGLEVYLQQTQFSQPKDLLYTGLLSLFILVGSWVGAKWAIRASSTAALAKRRGLDIANLSQLNQTIVDELTSGILVVESSGSIRHINSTAWEFLGKPDHWRKQPLREFAPEIDKHLQVWLKNVCPEVISCDIKHQGTMELRMHFTQLGTQTKGITLINLEDTTEQRKRVQEVKLASLGQLTANIAHEIRNPLGAISHSAQLLSESPALDKVDVRMVQIIQSNSKRMNSIIESVLNLSSKKKPQQETIYLKAWTSEFLDDFIAQSSLKKQQINVFISPADCTVEFDPAHLHQIMWNLCRNAMKHAHNHTTALQLDIQGGIPNHSRDVVLNICDNGRGVESKDHLRLFEPFFTTSDSGTGLGLFMSRELAMSNGGSLEYRATGKQGCCFHLTFSKSRLRD